MITPELKAKADAAMLALTNLSDQEIDQVGRIASIFAAVLKSEGLEGEDKSVGFVSLATVVAGGLSCLKDDYQKPTVGALAALAIQIARQTTPFSQAVAEACGNYRVEAEAKPVGDGGSEFRPWQDEGYRD